MLNKLKIFKNKRVIVTGLNEFKGTWLCIWSKILGAKINDISLKNNHFNLIKKIFIIH